MSTEGPRGRLIRLALYATTVCVAGTAVWSCAPSTERSQNVGSVQVVGSETVRPVITACAEEFMMHNPQADVLVKGGGSGDGVAALLHGIVDIGMVSRELSERERGYAAAQGIEITTFELGLDGITIVVHRDNPITALSLEQIRDVFAGTIRSWRELGGADGDIQAVARAEGSGTELLFGDRVLAGARYAATVVHLPTNEAIIAHVAAQPRAIGYSSLGALRTAPDRIKVVALRDGPSASLVSPSAETVRSKSYPLTRTLYLMALGTPSGLVKAFLDFCTGDTGAAFVQSAGYVALAAGSR